MLAGAGAVEREQMRRREVLDVDVVADRGAVGRRVVGAEDLRGRCLPSAARRTFGIRWVSGSWSSPRPPLAPATLKYRRLTAPSPCAMQKSPIIPSTASFEAPYALAGLGRPSRRSGPRRAARRPRRSRRTRGGDAGGDHRLEQVQRPADVRPVVALGVADRLRHERERREVQHAVEPVGQRAWTASRSSRSATTSGACRDRLAVPPLEVVEHDHLVAGREQLAGDDRADVAGAAGDEQLHGTE